MQLNIDLASAINSLTSLSNQLSGKDHLLSVGRSINRALVSGRTKASKHTRTTFKIPAEITKNAIYIDRSKKYEMSGKLRSKEIGLPFTAFRPLKQKKGGYTINIKGSRKKFPSAFERKGKIMARGEYKNNQFEFGNKQNKIRKVATLKTLAVPSALKDKQVFSLMNQTMSSSFQKNYQSDLKYRISRLQK